MADYSPDEIDMRLLEALQRDGRASYAELARAVSMSPSAVTERVRRLEDSGVIAGYSAVVNPEQLDLIATTPEIIEAHHVTGEDCFILKVVARSMRHLEHTTGRIAGLGAVTTTVVYSSMLTGRAITAASLNS
jgi:Lrp/AsnC family transcriptional regulator, leucine-responsive regulatory protein